MTSETRPKPSVWRFIAWQVNFREKTAQTYWDGRLASTRHFSEMKVFSSFENVSETPRPFPNFHPSILSSMFSGTKFYLDTYSESFDQWAHQWGDKVGKSKNLIKSKIAQLRVYPTALNEVQLLHIQTRSLWDLEGQDPDVVNHLTTRGPQNATFAEATAACAAQGKTMVTAASREAKLILLERAGSDLQSLSWVGALTDEGCTSKWKWSASAAPDECLMDKDSFWEGDFACFHNTTGLSLADAQQQCQNHGRILKVPRNEEFAMLSRIKLSCPGISSGCRICENPSLDVIAAHHCMAADGKTILGGTYGSSSQNLVIGLSSQEQCVVAGGTWDAFSIADIQQGTWDAFSIASSEIQQNGRWEDISIADIQQQNTRQAQLPGAKCAMHYSDTRGIWFLFGGSEGCLSQRHTMRMDAARDMHVECPQGLEARVDSTGRIGDLYIDYMCCPPSPTCSGPAALHYTYFCQGASSYHADQTDKCLAVLKFQGELQYISKDCSERLSYIYQDAPTSSVRHDSFKCDMTHSYVT